jgi:hypothetical protein
LNRWKIFFNQLINVCGVHDVRQKDKHTTEPLVPEPNLVEVEIANGKLKVCKSPGTDIPTELTAEGGEILRSEKYKIIRSIRNKEEFPLQRKESIVVPIHKKGGKTDCNNY